MRTIPWIQCVAAAVLAVTALSCEPGRNGPDTQAKIETSVSTSLGSAKTSIFLSVTAEGAWTIDLRYPSGASGWASVSPASGTGNKNSIVLNIQENTGESARTLEVVLNAEANAPMLTFVQAGKSESGGGGGGGGKPIHVDGYGKAYHHWLELPATSDKDAFDFFAHDMKGGDYYKNGGERNWSFYYDYDACLARWVAYPLNKGLIGSGSRSNAWGTDPLVPAANQQMVTSSYGTSYGWTRGHQIPSADRLNYNANVSTFYGTNMTPQDYDFNSGIWADLESRVRGWASSSDTLYVVTGCIVDPALTTITDKGGHKIKVPSAYYKALLRYLPGSTVGFSGYMAVGIYIPHDPSLATKSCMDYMMSIDELEKKTGVDFFVNLKEKVPQATADKVEAEAPNAWWKK